MIFGTISQGEMIILYRIVISAEPKAWLYFLYSERRFDKNENLHLPRKPESKRKAVVLERSGFYHNLRRNNSVGCDSGELLERPALCCDRLLCVSLASGRRNCNYGLYLQCCEVFSDLAAVVFMEEKLNEEYQKQRSGSYRS